MNEAFFDTLAAEDLPEDIVDRDNRIADQIYDNLFRKQQQVLDDPFRFKAVLTPRRAGKTYTCLSYAAIMCLRNPGVSIPIITLTLRSAKSLFWDPLLKMSDEFGLNLRRPGGLHHTLGEARFENGSKLWLIGAETKQDVEKLRGGEYMLVIVDECASFSAEVFNYMLEDVIIPATNTVDGHVVIIGTPGLVLGGPFFEATYPTFRKSDPRSGEQYPISRYYDDPDPYWNRADVLPEWSFHNWTVQHNVAAPSTWANALKRKKQKRWTDDNPTWVREYLGKWVAADDAMVYALGAIIDRDGYDRCRAFYRPNDRARWGETKFNKWGLPADHEWQYVLGLDIGYVDHTAFVVIAYSPTVGEMFLVYEHCEAKMLPTDIANHTRRIEALFDDEIEAMVADTGNNGKSIVEELNRIHGFTFEFAEKKNKQDYIDLLNGDLWDGKIKVQADSQLVNEWLKLQWDLGDKTKKTLARSGKLQVKRTQDDDLSDAFLYVWRFSQHHFAVEREPEVTEGTPEYWEQWDYEQAVAAAERRNGHADEFRTREWTDSLEDNDNWTMTDLDWLT